MANESLEHPSSNRVQELEKQAEEARRETERLTPIFGQFQQKIGSTKQFVPEDALEDVQEEEKEDEEDQEEQHEEESEQEKEQPLEVDSSDDADEEIV